MKKLVLIILIAVPLFSFSQLKVNLFLTDFSSELNRNPVTGIHSFEKEIKPDIAEQIQVFSYKDVNYYIQFSYKRTPYRLKFKYCCFVIYNGKLAAKSKFRKKVILLKDAIAREFKGRIAEELVYDRPNLASAKVACNFTLTY